MTNGLKTKALSVTHNNPLQSIETHVRVLQSEQESNAGGGTLS